MSDYPVRWDEDTTDCGACYVLARYIDELHELLKRLEDAARPTVVFSGGPVTITGFERSTTSTDSEDKL